MDWEDLRHFLTLAKAGSLSEAARRLKVDHTTVARRVAMLEAALGLRLIDRLPRAVALTPEGRRIATLGERMEDQAFAILRAARGADPTVSGTVRVSAPPAFASVVLSPRLGTVHERYPGIVVDLIGEKQAADLDRRAADIALRLSRPSAEGLIGRKVGEIRFAFYAAPGYADKTAAADWQFVVEDGIPVETPQQRWLEGEIKGRAVAFRANDSLSLAAAARAGMGVALLPHYIAGNDPTLIRLPTPGTPPCRDIWMVVHDDLRRAPRIRAVMDGLVEIIADAGQKTASS